MGMIQVSRQTVDEDNQLSWEIVEIDDADLIPGEVPYVEISLFG